MSDYFQSTSSIKDQGTSTSAFVEPVDLIEDRVLEHYQDIQLPSCNMTKKQGRSMVRNLTHPAEIRKRCLAVKRNKEGNKKIRKVEEEGSSRRKRKFEDHPGVFDHLATLLRKQKSQMESDPQEVPGSPQMDYLPADYPSFHSTQRPYHKPVGRAETKRALFASELSYSSDSFVVDALDSSAPSLLSREDEEEERATSASFCVPSFPGDQTLDHEQSFHVAQVPTLTSNPVHMGIGSTSDPTLRAKINHRISNAMLRPQISSPAFSSTSDAMPRPQISSPAFSSTSDAVLRPSPASSSNPTLRACISSPTSSLANNSFVPFRASGGTCHSGQNMDPEPFDARNFSILNYYPREE